MLIDELLLEYEKDFFKYSFCNDKEALDLRFHDDFVSRNSIQYKELT